MRPIVLTNWMLGGRSGTELYTRDLALGLKRLGWSPSIFSLETGPLADELRSAGVPVFTKVDDLPADIAIVHGHHNFMTVMALLACPAARGLFVCHSSISWQEEAPAFPRVLRYVGVDELCRERVAADLHLPLDSVRFVGNSVDLSRFAARAALPAAPRRALLFSNYAAEHTFLPVVREACQREGLELDVIGSGVLQQVSDPERVLSQYDLVFAKARCAMEAVATGCATVLCGVEGVGPMVNLENFDRLRRDNFGRRCLSLPMTVENLISAMRQYDAMACNQTSRHARTQLDLEGVLHQWCALYEELLEMPLPPRTPAEETKAAAIMLGKLASPLFQTFELESVKAHLQNEVRKLFESQALLQHGWEQSAAEAVRWVEEARRLQAKLKSRRSEWKSLQAAWRLEREQARTSFALTGVLAWLWRHRALRPVAKLLGVRMPRGRAKASDSEKT